MVAIGLVSHGLVREARCAGRDLAAATAAAAAGECCRLNVKRWRGRRVHGVVQEV